MRGGKLTERASRPALGLVWDFDNRLRGADTNGSPATQEVTFEYDALGRRVARSEAGNNVVYVHAGQQVIADYARGAAAAAPSFRYVYGSYVDEPLLRHAGTGTTLPTSGTAALYYHRNQQYSIVGLSDAAGTLVERYAYTAYGELTILAPDRTPRATSSFENRYTYTAREWDPTLRLYYFRARWLEPKAGRFIGRDPLGYVDGMGLYGAYFNLDHVDPYGTEKVTIIFNAFINGAIRGEWHDEPMAGFRPQDVFYAGFQANVQRQFRSNFRDFGEFDRGVENAKLYSIAEFDSNEIGNLESSSFVKSNGAGLSKQRWRWFWPHWGSTKVDYGQWNGPIELRPHIEPNEIEVEDLDKNTSKLTFSAGSKYPHVSVLGHNPSPPIDYKVSFTVTKICDWEYRGVLVELSGSRDRFPDYEAYAYESSRPASTFYEFFSPDKGPGFHNLGKPMDQPVSGSELIVFEYF